MAKQIRAIKTEQGLRFRIWSTISDSYITDELSEEEVREETLIMAITKAIQEHNREIDVRIKRASTSGTSAINTGDREIIGSKWVGEGEGL